MGAEGVGESGGVGIPATAGEPAVGVAAVGSTEVAPTASVESAVGLGPQQRRHGQLPPVSKRWPWVCGGLLLEVAGLGAPTAYVLTKASKEGVGGQLTRATVRLSWHQAVHSKGGLALFIAGVLVFVIGSVILARPFAKTRVKLLVAIPIAALAGVLVVGAAAVIVVAIVAIFDGADVDFGGGSGDSRGGSGSGSSSSGSGSSGESVSSGGSGSSTTPGWWWFGNWGRSSSRGTQPDGPDYSSFAPKDAETEDERRRKKPDQAGG